MWFDPAKSSLLVIADPTSKTKHVEKQQQNNMTFGIGFMAQISPATTHFPNA